MVRKIGQLLLNGERLPSPHSTFPLSNFRAKTVGPIWNFFHGRCRKDEPTAKNLVCKQSSPYSREKLEKPVGGMVSTPPPPHRPLEG